MNAASTFRFMYGSDLTPLLYRIRSVGRGTADSAAYRWNGMERDGGGIIFQYTLRGEGRISFRDEPPIAVGPNQAFIVTVPGEHCYYYDREASAGEPWEFVWIRLEHHELLTVAYSLTGVLGEVFEMKSDSEPIRVLHELLRDVSQGKLSDDSYRISVRAYEWITAMLRFAAGRTAKRDLPDAYRQALAYMDRHFAEPIGLEEVAAVAGLSKHHFCQMFAKRLGVTPWEYLLRRRMEQAAHLLKRTSLPIGTVALQSGFNDAGYFGKVFRKRVGVSPLAYRTSTEELSEEQVWFVD